MLTLEHLQSLDQAEQFSELRSALRRLDACCAELPAHWHGPVGYLRGKVALLESDLKVALPALGQACRLQPRRAHAHYLLGVACVRCGQWCDAQEALTRALELDPAHAPTRLELARVLLVLQAPAEARALLEALPSTDPNWVCELIRARVRASAPDQAPQIIAAALAQPIRLSETLLLEWLEIAGGFLLAGRFSQARPWLRALGLPTPNARACGHPIPRRPALLAALLLELLEPGPEAPHRIEDLQCELRSLLWLGLAESELQLWAGWLQPFAELVAGRLNVQARALDPITVELLVSAFPLSPSANESVADLVARLRSLGAAVPEIARNPALGLDWHRQDLPMLLEQWSQLLSQPDGELLRQRPELERALVQLSFLLHDRPRRLVLHPDPSLAEQAQILQQEALAVLLRANQRLAALEDPRPCHPRLRQRWLLLASDDLPQCYLFRVQQKKEQLEALGCECRIVLRHQLDDWRWSSDLLWADALLVCRLPATHSVLRAIHAARRAGSPIYYDIDDLIFDWQNCPPPFPTYGGTLNGELHRRFHLDVHLFAAAAQSCDGLIVSTPTLARRWNELANSADSSSFQVTVLPNLAPPALRRALQPPRRHSGGETIRIVVASGTTAHKQVWREELAPALAVLLERYQHVHLDLLGHLVVPLCLQSFAGRVRCLGYCDYSRYLQRLGRSSIGLVVLEPGTFTDAKSAIRWMEFSYLGLASVLSPTATYREVLVEGDHARFARGTAEWISQVEELILDPAECEALARRAQHHAQQLFGPQQAKTFWQHLVDPALVVDGMSSALAASGPPALIPLRRRRLLVTHVFFAPQSIGGATRVVQDQIGALMRHCSHLYDVTVLCTDHAPWQLSPGADRSESSGPSAVAAAPPVTIHDWQGARVVRLALPPRPWRHHRDPAMADFCKWWFALEDFDLIHAHCMQVLSVDPLLCAAEMGIPYAVTLHDGWWLSPRQFLITASGDPVNPVNPLGHFEDLERVDSSLLQSDRCRRRELDAVLAGAAVRLAVSKPFASLFAQEDVGPITVMENRWQPMASCSVREARAPHLPLRACCVGGMALHKGVAVLHAALLLAKLPSPGLQLTLVDGSLAHGDSYVLSWGGTPVRVVASLPMADMASFYAEHDLLIAPSIWPESYGLVTREALSAGLWVVASDIGALADPIRHGENGHRVPPGDAAALAAVLEQLCTHHPVPEVLLAFQSHEGPLHEQLDSLYRKILG